VVVARSPRGTTLTILQLPGSTPTVQKDLDFGSNGLAKFNFGDGDNFSVFSEDLLFDLLLQSDGKILAAGQSAVLLATPNLRCSGSTPTARPIPILAIKAAYSPILPPRMNRHNRSRCCPTGKIMVSGTHYYSNDDNEKGGRSQSTTLMAAQILPLVQTER
jgi:hypothetical protein